MENQTALLEFHLLGLTADPELQPLIFSMFLSIYLVTILGNLLIILAIISDSNLHTPMYFFLSCLSINDICFVTTTVPKMLVSIQAQDNNIPYIECITQLYFVSIFVIMENFLLAVMAYDRYVAICKPLRYMIIMNPSYCILLVLLCLAFSIIDAIVHGLLVLRLSFCTDMDIPHFFCELAQIIKLSCSDTFINNLAIFVTALLFGGGPICGIVCSYVYILCSVFRIPSPGGKHKAFSTCTSHLSVVSLFYGTAVGVYITSAVTDSPEKTTVTSVMYTVLPQMLNPFIYSLRNKDMKIALKKITGKIAYPL